MNRQLLPGSGLGLLQSLAALLLFTAACRPSLGGELGLAISCGSLGLTAPTVEITLDSTSARGAGKLALGALPPDSGGPRGTAVELHAQGAMVRCDAKAGKFRILIRGTTPVDGVLEIAAARPVDIVVRTAGGVQRAARAFDPRTASPTELAWTVGGP